MPQGRRKTPFSGKAKKQQLKEKKRVKDVAPHTHSRVVQASVSEEVEDIAGGFNVVNVNQQPVRQKGKSNPNRYVLQFHRDSPEELRKRKEAAHEALHYRTEEQLEIDGDEFFPPALDFPTRPPWNLSMSRDTLEYREHKYFSEYVAEVQKKFQHELSYFELNLETWRQLWRVLEMSEIILVIVDIRFCPLMFPPSLYRHVTNKLHKNMVLVLNKIDLAPAPLVVAWKHYFKERYPTLRILTFTSFPGYNLHGNLSKTGLKAQKRRGRLRMAAEGAQKLMECCEEIVSGEVDLSSWQKKISEEMKTEFNDEEDLEISKVTEMEHDTGFMDEEKYKGGVLTIGCIGFPNAGKSSLMNALMGKKVVSVSKTPGHTKHFQTIYLTDNVRLCDCPGLVFPSKVPKHLQVLMGSYPIAQLQEPYSSIRYIAERINLIELLKLQHVEGDEEWSAVDVCDAWAKKRGFLTAKAARLDSYRAANHLLRMATEGKICVCLRPPEYTKEKDKWTMDPEVALVEWLQAKRASDKEVENRNEELYFEEEDEEDQSDEYKVADDPDEPSSTSSEDEIGATNKFSVLAS